jgi:radical SAM protein with 4Fe4S-binding SPASM domain
MTELEKYRAFPYKIDSAVWELTLACCFHCAYCGSSGGTARENELSTEECLNVVNQLALTGCRRVSLIGGEVFLRPDWEEITAALTGSGIKVCIITNGYRMTPDILASLKKAGVESVAVSVDGPERVHDAYRAQGSYKRAFESISALCDAGVPVSVISALRADNAPLLPEFYETLLHYPIFAWQIQACSPMGNALSNSVDVYFNSKEVLKFIREHRGKQSFYIAAADNIGYYDENEPFVRRVDGSAFAGCSAGLSIIGIDSTGNVRGCEALYHERFNEGCLRERTLIDIWTDPDAFSYNRKFTPDLLTGKCAGCPHGDVCAGGCRSYDRFTTGRLYEHPLCARNM